PAYETAETEEEAVTEEESETEEDISAEAESVDNQEEAEDVSADEAAAETPKGNAEKGAKPKAPAEPQLSKRDKAKKMIAELCRLHNIGVIAIGNGTACRETEELVSETLREENLNVQYCIVNE